MTRGYNGEGQIVGAAAATAEAVAAGLPNPYDPPPPPKQYSTEAKRQVLELIADGATWRDLERMEGVPAKRTIVYWKAKDPAFASAYALAVRERASSLVDEALDAARDAHDKDSAAAGRVQTETFLKVAAVLDPERYAPKQPGGRALSVTINTNLAGPALDDPGGAYTITIEGESVQEPCSPQGAGGKALKDKGE